LIEKCLCNEVCFKIEPIVMWHIIQTAQIVQKIVLDVEVRKVSGMTYIIFPLDSCSLFGRKHETITRLNNLGDG